MRKGNGSNGIPGWVKEDLRMLKRVSVSLVEMHRENQRRSAENKKMIAEMVRRNDKLEEQTASLKKVSDIHTKAIMRILDKI